MKKNRPIGLVVLPLNTDEQKSTVREIALSMYAGEPCRVCGKNIETTDLQTAVFAGYKPKGVPGFDGRCAHQLCWDNLSTDDLARFQREAEIAKSE